MFYGPWPPNSNTGNPSPFRISVFTSTHWKDWNFLLDSIYDFHLKRLYALTSSQKILQLIFSQTALLLTFTGLINSKGWYARWYKLA